MMPSEQFIIHTWEHSFFDRESTKRECLEHLGDLINVAIERAKKDEKMIDELTFIHRSAGYEDLPERIAVLTKYRE